MALLVTLLVTLFCDLAVAQQENVNNLISTSAGLTREGHICREQTSCGDCIVAGEFTCGVINAITCLVLGGFTFHETDHVGLAAGTGSVMFLGDMT